MSRDNRYADYHGHHLLSHWFEKTFHHPVTPLPRSATNVSPSG
jgi:hypothetical protein